MKRVLLVDDEPVVLRVMRLALVKDGYDVDTAPNGKVAIEKIRNQKPDILVTDIEMPLMSGRELCEQIQNEMPDRGFTIFVSTSLTAVEHRDWSKHIDDLTFLEKPISVRKLRMLIERAVCATAENKSEIV